jgi:predicted  nucleic acid-binding Zn-ribbon protein
MENVAGCPSKMQEKHIEDLSSMKTNIETIKGQISDLSTMKDILAKQTVLQSEQGKRNEKLDYLFELQIVTNAKTEETLRLINDNLSAMNSEMKDTKTRVNELESSVARIPLESQLKDAMQELAETKKDAKTELENVKKHSFDILDWIKSSIFPVLLGGGLAYYILEFVKK